MTASTATRVLLVDDDGELLTTLELHLAQAGYSVEACGSGCDAIAAVRRSDFDVVVTDLTMREMDGIALCERIVESRRDIPVIVLTAFGSFESAVAAIRAGAYDFLAKPVQLETLRLAVNRAAANRRLTGELRRLRRELDPQPQASLVASSTAMRDVLDLVDRVASSEATVLVTGESGTGKEVVARAIHDASPRAKGPFVAINCAAVPESLLESELFGHLRGAFTDARASEPGLFVAANGGTLLLDEIGDMPISIQPKLLRALQERMVRPIGGNAERPIDVRVIAATNRDLESAIEEGRFREDLFYRINVVKVALPPLRARASDILPLATAFMTRAARRTGKNIKALSPACAEKLMAYTWPGNIRELQNCMEHAVALARFEEISCDDLPDRVRKYSSSHVVVAGDDPRELVALEEVERRYISRVMEAVAGNKSAAARVLKIDRKRLYRMLERLGLLGDRASSPRDHVGGDAPESIHR